MKLLLPQKIEILDRVSLIDFPLSEDSARKLLVSPEMKKIGFKNFKKLKDAIEGYPLSELTFANIYEALASQASMLMFHKWQDGIE